MMNLSVNTESYPISNKANQLLKSMVNPLCGMVKEMGFIKRAQYEAKVVSAGADLTGLHLLINRTNPGPGGYHIGANGIHFNEAIIKTLAESIERYSQLVAEISNRFDIKFLTYQQMQQETSQNVLPLSYLNFFKPHQFESPHFPFQKYMDQPLGWIKLSSLLGPHSLFVPAQLVLVGYQTKKSDKEPWLSAAVTTGTATHTHKYKALINAILELVQIDSAMGHWYSSQSAPQIILDGRTAIIERLIRKQDSHNHQNFYFHWLKNPDLVGFSIACVYRHSNKKIPRVAVGLGADVNLNRAMYKAYLEAVGVMGLARMVVFNQKLVTMSFKEDNFYDLDSNVAYYAVGNQPDLINKKFPLENGILAAHMPQDILGDEKQQLEALVSSFKKAKHDLLFCDLTCLEAQKLGLVVPRVWSPDILSLCLPSAPWLQHPRFLAYGGADHEFPHPYP